MKLLAILLSLFLAVLPGIANASILVAPTRLVLESGERVGQVSVMNRGNKPVTLRVAFVNNHMNPDGSFENALSPRPGERFADEFLRYSPRRVQLDPGESQLVRVLARVPGGEPAEYRSHLRFQVEPPARARSDDANSNQVRIHLSPVYGVSIPVFVRAGELEATAGIANVGLERDAGSIVARFDLARRGNRSVYGDIKVTLTPHAGEPRDLALVKGVAVYLPLAARQMRLPLDGKLEPGRLRIEYLDNRDSSRVLAFAEREVR